MGRSNKSPKSYKPVLKKQNTPEKVEVSGPSLASSAKSGFGFGMGSAAAHSVFSTISSIGSTKNNNEPDCSMIMKKYLDCLEKYHYNNLQPECLEIKKILQICKS